MELIYLQYVLCRYRSMSVTTLLSPNMHMVCILDSLDMAGAANNQQQVVVYLLFSCHCHLIFYTQQQRPCTLPKARWLPPESAHLAEAWVETSSEEQGAPRLKGAGQTKDAFWLSALKNFKKRCPVGSQGTHHHRGLGPTKDHWN